MNTLFYEAIISQMVEGFVLQDQSGSIIKFNASALKILGLSENQILGKTSMDPNWKSIHEDGTDFKGELHPAMIALKKGIKVFDTIMGVHLPTGELRWISINASPIIDGNNVTHAITTFKDITEEIKKKKKLEELQFRFDFALNASMIGVWDFDIENNILIWDDRLFEIYGASRSDFNSAYEAWEKCLLEDEKAKANKEVAEAIQNHTELNTKFKIRTLKNEIRIIAARAKVQLNSKGKAVRLIGVNWDITAEETYNEELVQLKVKAEEATLAKSSFLANTGHEIRTPLNGILGSLDLLDIKQFNEEQRDILNTIRLCGNDLLNLLNNVLDISKLEISQLKLSPTRILDTFQKVSKIASFNCESKGITFVTNIKTEHSLNDLVVMVDEIKFSQILNNLLNNAIKFTQKGEVGLIVSTQLTTEKVKLEIKVYDTGIGISQENIYKLFKPFEQIDPSITRKYGGSGLGLVIVKKIIDQFNGEIHVKSQDGIGTEFNLVFDLEKSKVPIEEVQLIFDTKKYSHLKILLVDDNDINIKVISKQLQKLEFQVDIARSGEEAIETTKNKEYDLILMDLQMPGIDGYQASIEILKRKHEHQLNIVALSANSKALEFDKCQSHGIVEYCQKPFSKKEFFTILSKLYK